MTMQRKGDSKIAKDSFRIFDETHVRGDCLAQVCNIASKSCSCDQLMWFTGLLIADFM